MLHEHASMLLCTYIAVLFIYTVMQSLLWCEYMYVDIYIYGVSGGKINIFGGNSISPYKKENFTWTRV
jgi:hypothetical protein